MALDFTQFSDQELLALIQKGEEVAFNALYQKYYLPLCKKAFLRLGRREAVEEVVQDVFVTLWEKAKDLDTNGNLRAYLYAVLRNNILYELRTEYNRAFYMKKIKARRNLKVKEKSLQFIYKKETEKKIEGIIKDLSPKCKQAFLLNRYEDLSYAEVAERMQISVKAVEKHISKALKILRHSF